MAVPEEKAIVKKEELVEPEIILPMPSLFGGILEKASEMMNSLFDIFIVYVANYFSFSFGLGGRWWQPGD